MKKYTQLSLSACLLASLQTCVKNEDQTPKSTPFDIDHEVVFSVCNEHIPKMTVVIRSVLNDLEK
jgi:hypothetical protein